MCWGRNMVYWFSACLGQLEDVSLAFYRGFVSLIVPTTNPQPGLTNSFRFKLPKLGIGVSFSALAFQNTLNSRSFWS